MNKQKKGILAVVKRADRYILEMSEGQSNTICVDLSKAEFEGFIVNCNKLLDELIDEGQAGGSINGIK